jgi:hypothetical protein
LIPTSTAICAARDPRGQPDPHAFTAEQKLIDARSLEEALRWLTPSSASKSPPTRACSISWRCCRTPTALDF